MNLVDLKSKFFTKARIITKIINYISVLIVIWILKFPGYYNYMLIASLLIPIIGILLVRLSNGVIKIEAKRNSSNPNALPVFFPAVVFAFRMYSDFNLTDYSNVWFLVAIVTILFSGMFFIGDRSYLEIENRYRTTLRVLLFSFIYSFGIIIGFNCVFDKSEPQIFTSTVIHKRIQSTGIKSYDIEFVSVEKKSEKIKLTIDKDVYNELQVGGNVTIYVFKGLFNIPWVEAGR